MSRDLSAADAEHLVAMIRDALDEEVVSMSREFITWVFQGLYRYAKSWVHEVETAAKAAVHAGRRIFMFYTTCPKFARVYGKNYVISVAEIKLIMTTIRSA